MAWYDPRTWNVGYFGEGGAKGAAQRGVDAAMEAGKGEPRAYDPEAARVEGRGGLESDYRRIGGVGQNLADRSLADLDRLGAVASGEREGAGEMASRRAESRNRAAQISLARSATGYGSAGAGRRAARSLATMATDASGSAAQAAAGDQDRARQMRLALMGQMRQAQFAGMDPAMRMRLAEMGARGGLETARMGQPENPSTLAYLAGSAPVVGPALQNQLNQSTKRRGDAGLPGRSIPLARV